MASVIARVGPNIAGREVPAVWAMDRASRSPPVAELTRCCRQTECSGPRRARKFDYVRTFAGGQRRVSLHLQRSVIGISTRGPTVKLRWIVVPLGGVMVGLAAHVAPVRAESCIESCFTYSCSNPSDWGCAYRNSCMSECNRHSSDSSGSFGAIAYGARSTAGGWAHGKATASAANNAALSECRKNGDDCELVASLSSGCAAVAAVESKGVFAVGQGSTRQQAQSRAMNACTSQHGSGCEIEVWACQ